MPLFSSWGRLLCRHQQELFEVEYSIKNRVQSVVLASFVGRSANGYPEPRGSLRKPEYLDAHGNRSGNNTIKLFPLAY